MTKYEREQLALIRRLAEAAGGCLGAVWYGGRHLRIEIVINAKRATLTVASTPSDKWSAARNAERQAQRIIRNLLSGVTA